MIQAALVLLRITLAVPGGYALTTGAVSLTTVLLAGVMPRAEAFVLAAMLGFLLYLGLLVWSFAERRLMRLALVMPTGALGTSALAHQIGG